MQKGFVQKAPRALILQHGYRVRGLCCHTGLSVRIDDPPRDDPSYRSTDRKYQNPSLSRLWLSADHAVAPSPLDVLGVKVNSDPTSELEGSRDRYVT